MEKWPGPNQFGVNKSKTFRSPVVSGPGRARREIGNVGQKNHLPQKLFALSGFKSLRMVPTWAVGRSYYISLDLEIRTQAREGVVKPTVSYQSSSSATNGK